MISPSEEDLVAAGCWLLLAVLVIGAALGLGVVFGLEWIYALVTQG